jgi:poly(beta-D-mannuronate) lyase
MEPPIAELPITAVRASGDDGNGPANMFDGDFGTRWSVNGQGHWLELDLGNVYTISQATIAWYQGDQREAFFDLEVSSDGVNWTPALRDQRSSGATTELETFSFSPLAARFVRYVGLGNSKGDWNSVTEMQMFGF